MFFLPNFWPFGGPLTPVWKLLRWDSSAIILNLFTIYHWMIADMRVRDRNALTMERVCFLLLSESQRYLLWAPLF